MRSAMRRLAGERWGYKSAPSRPNHLCASYGLAGTAACVSIRFAFLTCVVLASSIPRASAEDAPQLPGELGLVQALTIFRSRGLDLLIADANIASAEGDVEVAGALNN